MAKHKSGGKSKNGRDSNPQYLGVKVTHNQMVSGGSVLVRQRGTRFHSGMFVGRGGDDTLFAKVTGKVQFKRGGVDNKRIVAIAPVAEAVEINSEQKSDV